MTGSGERTIAIADSDRARIPFAMVGVVILVSSVAIVGVFETRSEPKDNKISSEAMERTVSAAQTAAREAVTEAAKKAAKEPITTTAQTPVGLAINRSGSASPEERFERYFKLRIYLQTQEALQSTGQTLSDGTRTTASIRNLDYDRSQIAEAIDRVELDVGMDSGEMETGTIRATIEDVRISVRGEDGPSPARTSDVTVTVGSTLFETRQKMQTFEDRLSMDMLEGDFYQGLGQKFAARVYPVAYGKAYYERMMRPTRAGVFKRLNHNKDTTVLLNSALYDVQKSVFGTTDPDSTNTMKGAWACFALRNAAKVADKNSNSKAKKNLNVKNMSSTACRSIKFLFGGVSGEPPTNVDDIVSGLMSGTAVEGAGNTALSSKETFNISDFATPAYGNATGEPPEWEPPENTSDEEARQNSSENVSDNTPDPGQFDQSTLNDVINRTYQIKVVPRVGIQNDDVNPDYPGAPSSDPAGENGTWNPTGDRETVVENSDVSVRELETYEDPPDREKQLYKYEVEIDNTYTFKEKYRYDCSGDANASLCGESEWEHSAEMTRELRSNLLIDGNHTFGTTVEHRGIDDDYEDIGGVGHGFDPHNFHGDLSAIVENSLTNVDDAGSVESQLESAIDGSSITASGDLKPEMMDQIDPPKVLDEAIQPSDRSALQDWLTSELDDYHDWVVDEVDPIQVSRRKLIAGDDPFGPLRDRVEQLRRNELYRNVDDPYANVPQKALTELRLEYLNSTIYWINEIESERSGAKDKLSDSVDIGGDSLGDVLGKAGRFLDGSNSVDAGSLEGSPLLGEVTFDVDASPTYLSTQPVTASASPAVRPERSTVEEPRNTDHAPMAIRSVDHIGWPGLPIIPWWSFWYVTVDAQNVHVKGEYARFELSATTGGPSSAKTTTLVRQQQPVSVEIEGQQRRVGEVEPLNFETNIPVVVPVPGPTLNPKPRYGVGDHFRINNKVFQSQCSITWDHVGPNFDPQRINPANCQNLKQGNGYSLTKFLPDVGGSGSTLPVEVSIDSDGDIDVDGDGNGVDECDDDHLEAEVNETGTEWEVYEEDADVLTNHYCNLEDGSEYREEFVELLNNEHTVDDDGIGQQWADLLVDHFPQSTKTSKQAIHYLVNKADNDEGSSSTSLYEEHDVDAFKTATEVNENEYGKPSHREGTIVTILETTEDEDFARVYDSEGSYAPKGAWLARKQSVRAKTTGTIVDEFALADEAVVSETAKEDDTVDQPWADYNCLAKATVPDETVLKVSIAGGFDAQPEYGPAEGDQLRYLRDDLSGGVVQFYSPNYPGNELAEDSNWRTLGSIEDLADDTSELDGRWSDGESYECGCSDSDDEEADSIQVPGGVTGNSERVHAGQGSVSLTAAIETADGGDCSDGLEVTFLNVGKGTSILVQSPNGENMLIDAGMGVKKGTEFSGYSDLKSELEDALPEDKGNTIDHLVVTHGDDDHEKFLEASPSRGNILEDFDVKNGYYSKHGGAGEDKDPTEAKDYIEDDWEPITAEDNPLADELGDVEINVFNPPAEGIDKDEERCGRYKDCNSIGMTITYATEAGEEKTFLIPSDIRAKRVGELATASDSPYSNVDVYLLPHHSSDKAVNTMVLCELVGRDTDDAICDAKDGGVSDSDLDFDETADSVVISNADGSRDRDQMGDNAMEILTGGDHGVPYYWTAEDGTIHYVVGGDSDDSEELDDPSTGEDATESLLPPGDRLPASPNGVEGGPVGAEVTVAP